MDIQKEFILKLCGFYVSDWHLITMLLPYINTKIEEKAIIHTILEENISTNVKTLVEKLNIKNRKNILKIDWKNKEISKSININKLIEGEENKEIVIIVNGGKEYIEKANKKIEKEIEKIEEKIKEKNINIKIIDCYEIIEFNGNIIEILDNHDKILNTSGEKEITDVFEDYVREEKIG